MSRSDSDNAGDPSARLFLLEEARTRAMESDFSSALGLLSELLQKRPDDIDALRLKGNVLEQAALEKNEYSSKRLSSNLDYLAARECYKAILRQDPRHTNALIDLGDHYFHLDAEDLAVNYYSEVERLLREGEFRTDWKEEVSDLLERANALCRSKKQAAWGQRLRKSCATLLEEKRD
jgi:tetratricopeptide (TPR) repeat protein